MDRVSGKWLTLSATSDTFSVTVFPTGGEECNRRVATMVRETVDLVSVVRSIASQGRRGCNWGRTRDSAGSLYVFRMTYGDITNLADGWVSSP